jgi:hypothetical protein
MQVHYLFEPKLNVGYECIEISDWVKSKTLPAGFINITSRKSKPFPVNELP